jgi:hypothetical protein
MTLREYHAGGAILRDPVQEGQFHGKPGRRWRRDRYWNDTRLETAHECVDESKPGRIGKDCPLTRVEAAFLPEESGDGSCRLHERAGTEMARLGSIF